METEQQIYERQGLEEYIKYQVEHETQPFTPGPAFSFVKVRETNAGTPSGPGQRGLLGVRVMCRVCGGGGGLISTHAQIHPRCLLVFCCAARLWRL